ncbi:MAG: cardiolipin synthase [Clostridia bacterium]|nr:cardiolipin synthase [Clostridia bacterium]
MDIDNDIKNMPKPKKKGEKNIFVTIFKLVAIVVVLIIQIVIMLALYTTAQGLYTYARIVFDIAKIVVILYLLYHHDNSAYKVSWILFILFFPVMGLVAYLLWGNSKLRKKKELALRKIRVQSEDLLRDSENVAKEILSIDEYKYKQIQYISKVTGFPVYKNQGLEYFEIGEKFFERLKQDLQKAEKYILLEFYILSKGKLWDEIFAILKEKANQGVKVELILDSLGCLFRLPKDFKRQMEEAGIELYMFNPFSVMLSGYINYRDHRKIVVIDGKIGYTGGVNIADEYVNVIEKYGHWKDGGIKIQGNCVWSYALIFLRDKEEISKVPADYDAYKVVDTGFNESNGYVLPCSDGPDNRKNPFENTFIQTINYAKKYVYLTTPYFITSETLLNSILNAARSGVDVRLVTPHIPDKKIVQIVTRSYYEVLLEAGVKVYEYKPGFIHAKTLVSDDDTSIIGTANLDYRSMHLNFECINFSYMTGEELRIKEDFEHTIKNCIPISLEEWKLRPITQKWLEAICSAFSPMF